ncbi:MAG: hypothetical protein ACRD4F_17110, partial [Candidatus Angelobacter sp.]
RVPAAAAQEAQGLVVPERAAPALAVAPAAAAAVRAPVPVVLARVVAPAPVDPVLGDPVVLEEAARAPARALIRATISPI